MEGKQVMRRQFSTGSIKKSGKCFSRQLSLDPRFAKALRFSFGRQSSLDPNRRRPVKGEAKEELTVPENLDSTMQLLFLSCQGDVDGVEDLLKEGIDVNSIDLDGRTALHIAACEGHLDVVMLLLRWKANVDARDRWGSTAAADAKFYGNGEVYYMLKARGATVPAPHEDRTQRRKSTEAPTDQHRRSLRRRQAAPTLEPPPKSTPRLRRNQFYFFSSPTTFVLSSFAASDSQFGSSDFSKSRIVHTCFCWSGGEFGALLHKGIETSQCRCFQHLYQMDGNFKSLLFGSCFS